MVVVFNAVPHGGIVQFTIQLLKSFDLVVGKAVAFIPEETNVGDRKEGIIRFTKIKTINLNSASLNRVANDILALSPDMVIFTDDGLVSTQILLKIFKYTKTLLCVHDATPHPSYRGLESAIRHLFKKWFIMAAYKKSDNIVLLSENSKAIFDKIYKNYTSKTTVLKLGAHVPEAISKQPLEVEQEGIASYFLFFGRLDKYKGIYNLLLAYKNIDDNQIPKMLIAGNGMLTDEEEKLIQNNENVILLKRYIEDSEMLWLFEHAKAVVLPYTEASQSGVLPMSYHFGVPVITTDLPGLTEFVDDGKTGIIVSNISKMSNAMIQISKENINNYMRNHVKSYYMNNLNWERNIAKLLNNLEY